MFQMILRSKALKKNILTTSYFIEMYKNENFNIGYSIIYTFENFLTSDFNVVGAPP